MWQDRNIQGDRLTKILNTLSGKSHEMMTSFMDWVLEKPELEDIFDLLLGCDDPSPIINELWKYYLWGINPLESIQFREFVLKYMTLSITLNLQRKDSDLSRKALLVGNVKQIEANAEELF